ncbi:MAG: helix-turn-helix domain-containing protein, partial [Magnetospirillum sp. WYHS-4]
MTTSILRAASMRRKHSLDIDEIGLELGAKVRRLRGEKGLSRAALAANLEATEERVRKGEAGRSGSFTPHEL